MKMPASLVAVHVIAAILITWVAFVVGRIAALAMSAFGPIRLTEPEIVALACLTALSVWIGLAWVISQDDRG